MLATLVLLATSGYPSNNYHKSAPLQLESDFQQIFKLAGYSTIFGAAVGLSTLPFVQDAKSSSSRIIFGGASLGFITGSILGMYQVAVNSGAWDYSNNQSYSQNKNQSPSNQEWSWALAVNQVQFSLHF